MILRRFTKHVTDQNWFAVGLDVIVVVVGIFLGMQVTEWNEERKDRGDEIEYLQRIKVDIKIDLESYQYGHGLTIERIEQIQLIQKIITNPELSSDSPGKFISSIERSTWASSLPVEAKAWVELVSSGLTLLIDDVDIRNGLFEYYSSINRWDAILDDFKGRENFSHATAGLLSAEQLTAIETVTLDNEMIEGNIAASKKEAQQVAISLSENEEAKRWLPKMVHFHVLASKVIKQRISASEKLLVLIDKRIKDNL